MDLNKLINDMIAAVSGIAKKDITLIEGFSKSQMQKIAE
jgi:molybdopterin-guanine dinucleotide biosynthesis protein